MAEEPSESEEDERGSDRKHEVEVGEEAECVQQNAHECC